MDFIKLDDGKDYPVRWDMLALKEYKSITGNDPFLNIDSTIENTVVLAYVGIKRGQTFTGGPCNVTQDDVAGLMLQRHAIQIYGLFKKQQGIESEGKGEVRPTG